VVEADEDVPEIEEEGARHVRGGRPAPG
jgi:hypothetical protein